MHRLLRQSFDSVSACVTIELGIESTRPFTGISFFFMSIDHAMTITIELNVTITAKKVAC